MVSMVLKTPLRCCFLRQVLPAFCISVSDPYKPSLDKLAADGVITYDDNLKVVEVGHAGRQVTAVWGSWLTAHCGSVCTAACASTAAGGEAGHGVDGAAPDPQPREAQPPHHLDRRRSDHRHPAAREGALTDTRAL